MCAVIGAIVWNLTEETRSDANALLAYMLHTSVERGRDGVGFDVITPPGVYEYRDPRPWAQRTDRIERLLDDTVTDAVVIGNLRAEPTTEYVEHKSPNDQQPYSARQWRVVHNGTIANDKELRSGLVPTAIDSAAIPELLAREASDFWSFVEAVRKLKGSYAIIANQNAEPDCLYVAVNYRPVWYIETPYGMFFVSARQYLPEELNPRMVDPYSALKVRKDPESPAANVIRYSLHNPAVKQRALVVCSGGLDSTVAAAQCVRLGMYTELIHFMYGSRAEGPEVVAVQAIGAALGVKVTLFPLPVYKKGDSPLLDPDSKVAGGEAGAEYAYEWVPARNLLLLSVATAYAEANGFNTVVLGNNLEEAGAYPDNEPEFIARFNDMLPFAVGDGKRVRVIMPVGNMMKHEIVKLGHELAAPMHLTWSCYRAGALHCGTCGPCYMRRTAFHINNLPEVIDYVRVD